MNIVFIVALISSVLLVGFGRFLYSDHMKSKAMRPAIREAMANPMTAPRGPRPKMTSAGITTVLMMDWTMRAMLFSSIFSMPVKAAWAVLSSAVVRIVKEAISMRGVMFGSE